MSELPAIQPDPEVFQAMDRLDDDQIVAEMKGEILSTYVYEFNEGGQTVRGLSKAGTDDAARYMALKFGETIREIEIKLESQDDDYAYFTAKAQRVMIRDNGTIVELDSAIGQKRQAKFGYSRKTKERYPNGFWYEQGGQKAMRNAKQKLMPAPIKQALISAYIEQGKVQRVPVGTTELKAALDARQTAAETQKQQVIQAIRVILPKLRDAALTHPPIPGSQKPADHTTDELADYLAVLEGIWEEAQQAPEEALV